jgi:hypothetical protein
MLLNRWNNERFVWDPGMVEGEEDHTEEGCRLAVGIGLKLPVDVDDERGADCGEQAGLQTR